MSRDGRPRLDRRSFAVGASAAGAVALIPSEPLLAQSSAGIEILAAGGPGEGPDQLARAIAEGFGRAHLAPRSIAVNVPRGMEGLASFAEGKRPRAVMMVIGLSTLGISIAENKLDTFEACQPLARMIGETMPIVTHPESKLRSAADLIAALKADASAVTFAGRTKGSADHQLILMLAKAAGADPAKIRYQAFDTSAQASFSLLTRKVMVATGAMPEFWPQMRGGTLHPLAISSPERMSNIDIPTLREQQVDVALVNWRGVVTRDAVGDALIRRFSDAIQKLVLVPGWKELLEQRYWTDITQDDAAFTSFVADETKRVSELLRA